MDTKDLKIEWLYRLKKKILFSLLGVLTLAIMVTMVFIAVNLRETLVDDSKLKTRELAVTINSNLHHLMILRSTEAIQDTLEDVVKENESVLQATILNSQGRVSYSSDRSLLGSTYDRYVLGTCICAINFRRRNRTKYYS